MSLPLQQQPPPPSDNLQSDHYGPYNHPKPPDLRFQRDNRSNRTCSNEDIHLFFNDLAPMDGIDIAPAPEPFVSNDSMYANVRV